MPFPRFVADKVAGAQKFLRKFAAGFFAGSELQYEEIGFFTRVGLAFSGVFLLVTGFWSFFAFTSPVSFASIFLVSSGIILMLISRGRIQIGQANFLTIAGHMAALLTFYFLSTRLLGVIYSTDSMIGTYMGVVKVLGLQNPYQFSIKPFLEQFGLPPSFYTPKVDGSFEFHLNYPALNFIAFIPFYLAGLHDLRDVVLIFHLVSVLVVFGWMPARFKAVGLIPFALYFPWAIAGSLTDSIWAFSLLLAATLWYRNRKSSFALVGLSVATKQLAILVVPYLLVRNWNNTPVQKLRSTLVAFVISLTTFLIPNLPFIFSSPNDWWSSVVSPYLPTSTPQVMGGVGFSEVLTRLGLNPPSSIFFLLTGLAFSASLFAYARWFSKLNPTVWILPAAVLFFYSRSFLNYFFFWAIPLLLELSRVHLEGMKFGTVRNPVPSLRMPSRIPRWLQGGMVPPLLLGLVLTAAFAGASGAYISKTSDYRVTVKIDGVADPDDLGIVTLVKLEISNIGTEHITPRFFVKYDFQPYLWSKINGTGVIPPGTNSTYYIAPFDPNGAVPNHSQFRVWVFDSKTGALVGQSLPASTGLRLPAVINPRFKWWTTDMSLGVRSPYGWKLQSDNVKSIDSALAALDGNWTSGVILGLNYTSSTTGQASVMITQSIMGNLSIADLSLERDFATRINQPGTSIFGASITDGTHVLYILFSESVSQTTVHAYAENTTAVVPLSTSAWSSLTIDLNNLWESQSWSVPKQFALSFFIEATAPGIYYARLGTIT